MEDTDSFSLAARSLAEDTELECSLNGERAEISEYLDLTATMALEPDLLKIPTTTAGVGSPPWQERAVLNGGAH